MPLKSNMHKKIIKENIETQKIQVINGVGKPQHHSVLVTLSGELSITWTSLAHRLFFTGKWSYRLAQSLALSLMVSLPHILN